MSCPDCNLELDGEPNALCPNVIHWKNWAQKLEATLNSICDAVELLLNSRGI
jgi:hypothetical protein